MFHTAVSGLLLVASLLCISDAARLALLDLLTSTPAAPLSCITDTGKHVPVGQSIAEEGLCRVCECSYHGLSCVYADCLTPMCVDYVGNACCYTCPNGQNCRLPSGELISAPVERDGMRCECPPQDYALPGVPSPAHTTAICTPSTVTPTTVTTTTVTTTTETTLPTTTTPFTTTTPSGCVTDSGEHLQVGQSNTELSPGACRICECTFTGLSCIYGDCLPPMCVDYTRQGCCYTCPNGQNCRLPSGELISAPVERDGMRCECPPQDYIFPGVPSPAHTTAICTPTTVTTTTVTPTTVTTTTVTTTTVTPTTVTTTRKTTLPTTTPSRCVTDSGQHLQVGQSVTNLYPGACRICQCTYFGLSCMYGDCLPPMCVDYVRDSCCYRCPNGPNCRLPSGELISAPVERDGMRCACPPQSNVIGPPSPTYTTALCTPLTTISIVG